MRKRIELLLLCALLVPCIAGCTQPNATAPITTPPPLSATPSVSPASPRDDTSEVIVSRYYGNLSTNKVNTYDIKTLQADTGQHVIDLSFYDYSTENLAQHLIYEMRDDFRPDTIHEGLRILDVNQDEHDDIIMELGNYGPLGLSVCFLYSVEQHRYIVLPSFDELIYPQYNSDEGVFEAEYPPDALAPIFRRDKYKIENDELVLTAMLTWEHFGDTPLVYTEQHLIDGNMVIVKDGVPESDIDLVSWMFPAQYIKAMAAT